MSEYASIIDTCMKKKIGLVIQGALTSVGRTGHHMRQSPEELKKHGGIVEYDCRENINETIRKYGHLFDHIVVSVFDNQLKPGENFPGAVIVSAPDPGGIPQQGHYKDNNKHRQFISTLNGIEELERKGVEYIVKTRTDISLDFAKLLESFFANDTNKMGVTVMHPKTFLLHDLYFIAKLEMLKKFCEAIEAFGQFEFIPSVHRDMLLKHAYVEYRNKINVPDWAYFPHYPPVGVCAATREVFDYMFKHVYFNIDPEVFAKTLWRGTYFPDDHIASLTKGASGSRRYSIPALIATDWKRYFHFRRETAGKSITPADKVVIVLGALGWDLWNLLKKTVHMVR